MRSREGVIMTVQKKPKSSISDHSTLNQVETNGIEKSSSSSTKENSPTSRRRLKQPGIGQDPVPGPQDVMDGNTEARIAARAYEMYEERMRLGQSLQDWLRAEQEVLAMTHNED